MPKAEAVSPKVNPPSGNPEAEGGRTNPPSGSANSPRATPKRCMPKRGSGEPEGQLAEQQPRSGACRKAEAVSPKANPPRATPKRCMPKSGSSEPEGQLAERQSPKRKAEAPTAEWKNQPAQRPPSKRKAISDSKRPPRSGACRKAEAVSPKANPPSGNSEAEGGSVNPPSGKRRNGRQRRAAKNTGAPSCETRRSKPRNEGSAEQCRHTYQYNRKTRL